MPRLGRYLRVVFVLLAAVQLLTGIAQAQELSPVVSMVNGDPIPREAFHGRLKFVRWEYLRELDALYEALGGNLSLRPEVINYLAGRLEDPPRLGDEVLYVLEEERVLWQKGEELGVTPTAEDAQWQEAVFFSRWTDVPIAKIDTDPEAQAFIAEWYAGATAASGLTANDIRILFETEALRSRLFEYIGNSVPRDELAVNSRHILCAFHPDNVLDITPPTDEERAAANTCAETAMIRLANGEAFEDVVTDLSDDFTTRDRGGEIGWQFINTMLTGYADAVRDAEVNVIIGPVETDLGIHVIEVLDREVRELTDEEYEASQRGYFSLWVETVVAEATIERSPDWDIELPTIPGLDTLPQDMLEAIQEVRE